jgi:alkyl hydroperoxide reductase subunit AhpC
MVIHQQSLGASDLAVKLVVIYSSGISVARRYGAHHDSQNSHKRNTQRHHFIITHNFKIVGFRSIVLHRSVA